MPHFFFREHNRRPTGALNPHRNLPSRTVGPLEKHCHHFTHNFVKTLCLSDEKNGFNGERASWPPGQVNLIIAITWSLLFPSIFSWPRNHAEAGVRKLSVITSPRSRSLATAKAAAIGITPSGKTGLGSEQKLSKPCTTGRRLHTAMTDDVAIAAKDGGNRK